MNENVYRALIQAYKGLPHSVADGVYVEQDGIPARCRWCGQEMYPHKHGALVCLVCDVADRSVAL